MKSIALAVIALAATVTAAVAAPAVTTGNANIRQGPGTQHPVSGSVPAGTALDGECYDTGWCLMTVMPYTGLRGWISSSLIRFTDGSSVPAPRPPGPQPQPNPGGPGFSFDFNWGQPQPQPQPPRPPRPQPQPPVWQDVGACFYTERNFRGTSFCLDEGDSFDRLPRAWNDRIRSVEVFGGARVDLCTDSNFYGSCVTLRSNTSRLPAGIDRRASSVDVY